MMQKVLVFTLILFPMVVFSQNDERCGWKVAKQYISCFDDQISYRDISDSFYHAMNRHCYECNEAESTQAKGLLGGLTSLGGLWGTSPGTLESANSCKGIYQKSMVATFPSLYKYFKDKENCKIDRKALAEDAGVKESALKMEYSKDPDCQYVGFMAIEPITPYRQKTGMGERPVTGEPVVGDTINLCASLIRCTETSYDVVAGDEYDMSCYAHHCLDKSGKVTHDNAIKCFRDFSLENQLNNLYEENYIVPRSEGVEVKL